MKFDYNKASTDILLVLSLRQGLDDQVKVLLKERLAVNAGEAEKFKRFQRSWDYLTKLSECRIDSEKLPASLPPAGPFVDWLRQIMFLRSNVIPLVLLVFLFLGFGYWRFSVSQDTHISLAQVSLINEKTQRREASLSIKMPEPGSKFTIDNLINKKLVTDTKVLQDSNVTPHYRVDPDNSAIPDNWVGLGKKAELGNSLGLGNKKIFSGKLMVDDKAGELKSVADSSLAPNNRIKEVSPVNISGKRSFIVRSQEEKLDDLNQRSRLKAGNQENLSVNLSKSRSPATQVSSTSPNKKMGDGFVVRAYLDLRKTSIDQDSVAKFLAEFKPQKAGQVELGWQKEPTLFYYHFFAEEKSEAAIKEGLAKMGRLKWSKELHPRKLLEGQTRIILEVRVKEPL
jgi:hypothetical protein